MLADVSKLKLNVESFSIYHTVALTPKRYFLVVLEREVQINIFYLFFPHSKQDLSFHIPLFCICLLKHLYSFICASSSPSVSVFVTCVCSTGAHCKFSCLWPLFIRLPPFHVAFNLFPSILLWREDLSAFRQCMRCVQLCVCFYTSFHQLQLPLSEGRAQHDDGGFSLHLCSTFRSELSVHMCWKPS